MADEFRVQRPKFKFGKQKTRRKFSSGGSWKNNFLRLGQDGRALLLIFLRRNLVGLVFREQCPKLFFLGGGNRQRRCRKRFQPQFLAGDCCLHWQRLQRPFPQQDVLFPLRPVFVFESSQLCQQPPWLLHRPLLWHQRRLFEPSPLVLPWPELAPVLWLRQPTVSLRPAPHPSLPAPPFARRLGLGLRRPFLPPPAPPAFARRSLRLSRPRRQQVSSPVQSLWTPALEIQSGSNSPADCWFVCSGRWRCDNRGAGRVTITGDVWFAVARPARSFSPSTPRARRPAPDCPAPGRKEARANGRRRKQRATTWKFA